MVSSCYFRGTLKHFIKDFILTRGSLFYNTFKVFLEHKKRRKKEALLKRGPFCGASRRELPLFMGQALFLKCGASHTRRPKIGAFSPDFYKIRATSLGIARIRAISKGS